jgi:hypothetical protein
MYVCMYMCVCVCVCVCIYIYVNYVEYVTKHDVQKVESTLVWSRTRL